jgi:hypothetical protein
MRIENHDIGLFFWPKSFHKKNECATIIHHYQIFLFQQNIKLIFFILSILLLNQIKYYNIKQI